jgi:sec-independent protein translocase protein TatA
MQLGPTELILILVIVVIFFGVGRLPEVFGSVGKGLREFRSAVKEEEEAGKAVKNPPRPESPAPVEAQPVEEHPAETEETSTQKQV